MKMKNPLYVAVVAAGFGLALSASPVFSQQTVTGTATATVQSTLTITATSPTMSFGNWAVQRHGGGVTTLPRLQMTTNGTAGVSAAAGTGGTLNGRFVAIDTADRSEIRLDVSDGPANQAVTVRLDAGAGLLVDDAVIPLTCAACTLSGVFNLQPLFAGDGATNTSDPNNRQFDMLLTAGGTGTLRIGGILESEENETYETGVYEASFDVVFSF